ncbi:MAG: PAS domain-containing protein, partial [Microcystaceae cyanobacterium]
DRHQWLHDDQGHIIGVIGMIADITPRKQTEAQLAASEAKLKQLAIAQPGTLYTLLRRLDGSFTLTDLSPQSEELFEVAIEDALANSDLILQQLHPEDLAGYVQLVEESQAHLSSFHHEFRIITPSGRLKWIQANSSPVQLATGEVAWYGITLEITDRKLQEAQLQESESRFRQLAENIHQVFYLTNKTKGQLLYISPSYETMWQRSRESLYANPQSYVDAVLEADRPLVIQAYQEQLQGQNTEIEYRIVRPDGSVRWILDRTFVVQTATAQGQRVCGIAEDITERKQIEIALKQETEFNQLIAEISHRLVNVNPNNLEAEIQNTLERIGEVTQVESCVIFRFNQDTQTMTLRYEKLSPEGFIDRQETQIIPFSAYPRLVATIQAQQVYYLSHLEQAPPEAAIDVQSCQQLGLASILAVPLVEKGEAIGFLGVASSTHPMNWTTESIRLLTILTQTLANTRERVQAEIELQITSERLKEAQRIACIGSWELNHLNGHLYWSEEVFTIFELDSQTFAPSYEAFLALVHPEDRQDMAQAYTQHLQDGVSYRLIHRLALPSGQVKYLQEQCETLFDESGQPLLSKGTVQDVTALKQAENQLQILNQDLEHQVRQRTQEIWDFKLALDESALVVITDAQGVITYVNDRFCEMSGYSREEFLGRTHRLVKSGEHPPAFYRQLWQTITAGQVWRGEICNRKKNGDRYWVASTIVPFLDTQGEPYQYLAIRFDVTARKQAEMQLQKLSERLGLALKAGEIGCWEWNIVENTLTWDERMFALYGHPPTTEQLPYRIWSQGVYEPDRAATERLLHQTVAGEAEYDTEFRVLHPDGSIGFIKAYGLVTRNPEGQPQKMIGVNFDITQQKTAELELRRQAEKETLLRQISLRIRQTLDLSTTFNTACQEIREFLQVDRVAIFRFYPNSGYDDGEFVAESLKVGFSSVLAVRVHGHCFGEGYS